MENSYLIPANSKKSMLIFGHFNTVDLIIFLCGIGISFLLLMFLPVEEFIFAVISIIPGAIAALLVFPVPNYHNVRTAIKSVWDFYMNRQVFVWKGWCIRDAYSDNEQPNKK